MARTRTSAAANFALAVDGVHAGFLRGVEGGSAAAEVVVEQGSDFFAPKHLGALRYEPLTLACDLSLDKVVYDWIGQSWKGIDARHDAAVVSTDFDLKPVSEREFLQARVSSVTVPALDAASKDSAQLTVQLESEYARTRKASGTALKRPAARQKQWLPSNFKLAIDGLDAKRVSRIDSFTVAQASAADEVGELRELAKTPSKLDFPNL